MLSTEEMEKINKGWLTLNIIWIAMLIAVLIYLVVGLYMKDKIGVVMEKDVFEKLGFDISEFGGNTFAVGAIPSDASKSNIEKLLLGILDDLVAERKLKSVEERKL